MNREEAIELKNTLLWDTFKKELNLIIAMETEGLIGCKDPSDIIRRQEKIKAMRECILLPDNIAKREEYA